MSRRKKRPVNPWEQIAPLVLEFLHSQTHGADIGTLETWALSVTISKDNLHQSLSWLRNEGRIYSPAGTTLWCGARPRSNV